MRHSAFIQLSPQPLVPVNLVQSFPIMTQSQIIQPLIQVQPPLPIQVHPPPQPQPQIVRQRPIHVVDLEQYDDIWRKKVEDLERQLRELQNKPLSTPKPEPIIELRAGADTEDLEKQISQLQLELYKSKEEYEDLLQKYKESLEAQNQLKEQIKNHICTDNTGELKSIIAQRDSEIERLKKQLANQKPADPVVIDNSDQLKLYQDRIAQLEKQLQDSILQAERFRQESQQFQSQVQFYKDQNDEKDEIIKDLQRQIEELKKKIANLEKENAELKQQIDDLNAELDELQGDQEEIIEQKIETIRNEIKTWKDKFLALNVQFHDQQEKLMLTEAELDHIKKQQGGKGGASQVTTTTTTKTTK